MGAVQGYALSMAVLSAVVILAVLLAA
jgi:hypothetical protein